MEVSQHVNADTVRCVLFSGGEGLYRGMEVAAPGRTIEVPVGASSSQKSPKSKCDAKMRGKKCG